MRGHVYKDDHPLLYTIFTQAMLQHNSFRGVLTIQGNVLRGRGVLHDTYHGRGRGPSQKGPIRTYGLWCGLYLTGAFLRVLGSTILRNAMRFAIGQVTIPQVCQGMRTEYHLPNNFCRATGGMTSGWGLRSFFFTFLLPGISTEWVVEDVDATVTISLDHMGPCFTSERPITGADPTETGVCAVGEAIFETNFFSRLDSVGCATTIATGTIPGCAATGAIVGVDLSSCS